MSPQQRSIETRARILQAAQQCFAQRGYDATSVSDICERAGVSKGAFYHHFPAKHDVFLALLSDWLSQLESRLSLGLTQAESVPDGLREMARLASSVFENAENQLPMFLEFWTKAARDPQVWEATIAPYQRFWTYFSKLIEAGIQEGSLREVDSMIAARVLVSFAVGLLLQALLDVNDTDWGEVAQEGIQMILQGLERRDTT
ncbi:MAG: TetR/AcrR family transcriptional regulator [Anaerolineae bacterium]|nr:TetR/AcrR family transcriptional regulator [Anaerolineae bacterium]